MEGRVQRDCAAKRASHTCMPSHGRRAPVCVELGTEYTSDTQPRQPSYPHQPSAFEGGGGVGSQPKSRVEAHNVTCIHGWSLTEEKGGVVGNKELFPFTTIQNPPELQGPFRRSCENKKSQVF